MKANVSVPLYVASALISIVVISLTLEVAITTALLGILGPETTIPTWMFAYSLSKTIVASESISVPTAVKL